MSTRSASFYALRSDEVVDDERCRVEIDCAVRITRESFTLSGDAFVFRLTRGPTSLWELWSNFPSRCETLLNEPAWGNGVCEVPCEGFLVVGSRPVLQNCSQGEQIDQLVTPQIEYRDGTRTAQFSLSGQLLPAPLLAQLLCQHITAFKRCPHRVFVRSSTVLPDGMTLAVGITAQGKVFVRRMDGAAYSSLGVYVSHFIPSSR